MQPWDLWGEPDMDGGIQPDGGDYWFLIDPPVCPYSRPEQIRDWIAECDRMLQRYPGQPQWLAAKREAEQWLETALRVRGGR
jgi:hypothetical protein